VIELLNYFKSIVPADWQIIGQASTQQQRELNPRTAALNSPAVGVVEEHSPQMTNARVASEKLNVTSNRLRTAMSCLDPDMPYDEWVRIGMALHHQYDGLEEGFALWDEWSSKGTKYEADTLRASWRSFNNELQNKQPITAATIISLENQQQREKNQDKMQHFLNRYVFVEEGNMVYDLQSLPDTALYKLMEFRNDKANERRWIAKPTAKNPNAGYWKQIVPEWLASNERKSARGARYNPAQGSFYQDEQGISWVNRYSKPEHKYSEPTNFGNFKQHMEYLIPIESEREWFIDWMAFTLQKPEKRCKVTPLHVAQAHGTGRGWVVELLEELVGEWNLSKTTMGALCGKGSAGQFNSYLCDSTVCTIEEVKEGEKRWAVSNKIRGVLTEDSLPINRKYIANKTEDVYTNFFMMTNHKDALALKPEDRRIQVLTGPDWIQSEEYYKKLYAWLKGDGPSQLYHWLMKRDISDFNWWQSTNTPGRQWMLESNQSSTGELFREVMDKTSRPWVNQNAISQCYGLGIRGGTI